jgi:hypothetical protein
MLRILLLIVGAIVVVFLALAVVRTFFWLALIALIVVFVASVLGIGRGRRRAARRANRRF